MFFFVEQTRLVLNDLKYYVIGNVLQLCSALSTSSSFLVFAIVGPKYLFWNYSPKGCFSFTTHSLYSLDIRGGVELGLSFPLQWHNSYRQLVKSFWQTRTNYRFGKLRRVILQHRGIAHHSLCGSSLVNVIWLRTPTDGREQEKSMIFQFSPGTRLGWNGL